jgi:hypothetical protein
MTTSNIKSALTFGIGFAGGWAARSLADSPQGVGVKLMQLAINARERATKWGAVASERMEDMLAEARSRIPKDATNEVTKRATSGPGHNAPMLNEEA